MSQTNEAVSAKVAPISADIAGVTAGLQSREQTAAQLGVSERTVLRWEQTAGLPVITVGKLRLHDPNAVRAWLLARRGNRPEPPHRGRPRKVIA